jgi:hypothetical protein
VHLIIWGDRIGLGLSRTLTSRVIEDLHEHPRGAKAAMCRMFVEPTENVSWHRRSPHLSQRSSRTCLPSHLPECSGMLGVAGPGLGSQASLHPWLHSPRRSLQQSEACPPAMDTASLPATMIASAGPYRLMTLLCFTYCSSTMLWHHWWTGFGPCQKVGGQRRKEAGSNWRDSHGLRCHRGLRRPTT